MTVRICSQPMMGTSKSFAVANLVRQVGNVGLNPVPLEETTRNGL